jgi:copper chaperone NosL
MCGPRTRALGLGAVLALALGCGGGPPQPVAIALDEDICSYCRMAVSERQFAAELVTPQGRVEVFDDVGCLVDWLREHGRPPGAAAFVVDFGTGQWLAAEGAAYVRSPELPTPMRHGLAAFADRPAAAAASRELGGEVVAWGDLGAEAGR